MVTRDEAIAYRVTAQGLHRDATRPGDLDVFALGVQEAMGHPASVILAARVEDVDAVTGFEVGPGSPFALAWSLRGAPHVHPRTDLDRIAKAVFPLSEADAATRLNENAKSVERAGIAALDQVATATKELRAVVRTPTPKGEASTAVTKRLPEAMQRECRPCKAVHISDSAMRVAALLAGLELDPGTSPPVLLRRPKAALPKRPDVRALQSVIRDYLRFLGPAGPTEVAGFLGARRADVAEHWPDDLVEVTFRRKKAWLPDDADLDAPAPGVARLLGPFDPYLQARDRDVIVPDTSLHKRLWPTLGRPGAVFADGEIVGTWRTRASGKRLTIRLETGRLTKQVAAALEDEAQRVAAVRGFERVTVQRD
ncbi:winged helix DNA-binding domain-containing protein [Jatrophihabitans fulvus]